jgi:2-hydroxychromene-2-carboxylate isomerase
MGQLIVLSERRADRSRPLHTDRPAFFFEVACPFSYLAAERVERLLGDVEWLPTAPLPGRSSLPPAARAQAELRAAELRLPLSWPDHFPAAVPGAARAAAAAAEDGCGGRFALAAARLAFCGGFDLQDPEILAEAAAAAGMPLERCLEAVGDESLDLGLEATAQGLAARGVHVLPAVRIGRRWFSGERGLNEAAALRRALATCAKPLAPAG